MYKIENGVIVSTYDVTNFDQLIDFIKRTSLLSLRAKWDNEKLEFVFWEHDNDLRIGYFSVRVEYQDDDISLEQCAGIFAFVFSKQYQDIHTPTFAIDQKVSINYSKLKISDVGASNAPPFFDIESTVKPRTTLKDIRNRLNTAQK